MPNFGLAEQYGIPVNDLSEEAWAQRAERSCPFRGGPCRKSGGVCSITDGSTYAVTCPERFRIGGRLYEEVARLAFGSSEGCIALSEIPFLEAANDQSASAGSIDNVIVQLRNGNIADWCGLEIQAVYFSGASFGAELDYYNREHKIPNAGSRRPDFRSSGPKRLLPQLEVEVPTLRRWGKKMFVAVDKPFFDWMPAMKRENHLSNADVCWMAWELDVSGNPYELNLAEYVFATLEESRISLVAGTAGPLPEFNSSLAERIDDGNKVVWRSAT